MGGHALLPIATMQVRLSAMAVCVLHAQSAAAGPDVAPPGPGAAGHGAARARDEQPAADAAGEPLARTRSEAELAAALAMSMEEAAPPLDHSAPPPDQSAPPPPPDQEAPDGVAQLAGMGFEPAAARALRATGGDPALL